MKEFLLISPEIVLALTFAFIIAAEITYSGERVRFILSIAVLGLASAFLQTLICYEYEAQEIFGGVLAVDGFSLFFKLIFILLAMISIFSVSHNKEISTDRRAEYCALIVASTLALCLVAATTDLILTFLSLLCLNVLSYFLAAYGQKSLASTEASVKYLMFGAVASALFLYAASLLFAFTHSLNIYEIHASLLKTPLPYHSMLVIFILIFFSFSFQVGAFPMHYFMPDVLEGSPTPVSAFLSVGSRAAGFALSARFLIVLFTQAGEFPGQWKVLGAFDWTQILSLSSGVTMAIGSLLATRQMRAKRLVAHLVVAETGFLLLGILVLDEIGITALLYNLVVDLFSLCGIFYILTFLLEELKSDRLEDLRGMLKKAVPECIYLILFLLCLVGSPPLSGFIGKFTLLGAALRHQRPALVVIGICSMVLSMTAVIRLCYHLIGDIQKPIDVPIKRSLPRKIFLNALLLPMILVGVFADIVFLLGKPVDRFSLPLKYSSACTCDAGCPLSLARALLLFKK